MSETEAAAPPGVAASCVGPVRVREPAIQQIAALCYRRDGRALEVLLITSRETGRWVIPKGRLMRGVDRPGAAAIEANEEAGVVGLVGATPLGSFSYTKRLRGGRSVEAVVEVYPLEVTELLDTWKEAEERTRRWVAPDEAATMVDEPDLAVILREFRP